MSIATNPRFACANAGSPKLDLKGCVLYAPLWSPNTAGATFMSSGAYGIPSHLCTVTGSPTWSNQGRTFTATSSQYINLSATPFASLTNSAILAWINYTTIAADSVYFAYEQDANNRLNLYVANASKKATSEIYVGGVPSSIMSDAAVTAGTSVFVACLFGTGGMTMYVNGVLQADTDVATSSFANITAIETSIGRLGDLGVYWNGGIDEILILNRRPSAPEINQIYNSTRGRY